MPQTYPSPFPREVKNVGTVVDEQCECGHLRTKHDDSEFEFGHGACRFYRCACSKFSWYGFVKQDDPQRRQSIPTIVEEILAERPAERHAFDSERLVYLRRIEDTMESALDAPAWNALGSLPLRELREVARWLAQAKIVFEKAAGEAAMHAVSVAHTY